jgi:enhancing lycopene biosynthesis protein 2
MFSSRAVKRSRPMRRVALVLSGCGVYDGTEVQEAVATILALERAGAQVLCTAPNVPMPMVINHFTGHRSVGDERNVLVESARIARGMVRDLATVLPEALDAAVVPGGYGVSRVLCAPTHPGADARVLPVLEGFLRAMHGMGKPLGFLCLGPLVAARLFGSQRPRLGLGNDPTARADMEALGAEVIPLGPRDLAVDREHRFVCAAAFTSATHLAEAYEGIERLVRALFELMD